MTTPPDIARDAIEEIKEYNKIIQKKELSIALEQKSKLEENSISKQNIYSESITDFRIKIQKERQRFRLRINDFLEDLDSNHNISYTGNIEPENLMVFFVSVLNK